uniref:Uncharacterized protein n=1 Tax=Brassica campestris TaxID=3711 RepID=A0A3P6DEE8_BRACM|nr:unnamed protein product [Brassica rapa]
MEDTIVWLPEKTGCYSTKMITLPPTGVSKPLFPWLLWNLWTCRNQLLFEDKKFTESEVLNKAIRDAKEWSLAQVILPPKPPSPPPPR